MVVVCVIAFVFLPYIPGGRAFLADLGLGAALPGGSEPASGARGPDGAAANSGRAALVVLGEATEVVINDRVTALGTGAAVQSATLMPSDSGLLTEVRVASGAEVAAREVIATLDPASARVAYDAARIAHEDAQRTLDRYRQLGSSASASETQLQAYQLAADKAELDLRQARIDLDNRQIVSPIAGTIGIIAVNPGVEVTQSTVIATVEDNSAIKVDFDLPERFVGKVRAGDRVSAVPVSQPGTEFEAVVTAVDNRIDQATGSFALEARIANTEHRLRAGMSFTMTMRLAGDTHVAVPPLAVQWGSEGAYVWRVTDDVARRVDVNIVQRNAETVLVTGDLRPGERVVTEGLEDLRDGMAVRVLGAAENAARQSRVAPAGGETQPAGAAAASPLPPAGQ